MLIWFIFHHIIDHNINITDILLHKERNDTLRGRQYDSVYGLFQTIIHCVSYNEVISGFKHKHCQKGNTWIILKLKQRAFAVITSAFSVAKITYLTKAVDKWVLINQMIRTIFKNQKWPQLKQIHYFICLFNWRIIIRS